jgi:hypothetical protein
MNFVWASTRSGHILGNVYVSQIEIVALSGYPPGVNTIHTYIQASKVIEFRSSRLSPTTFGRHDMVKGS